MDCYNKDQEQSNKIDKTNCFTNLPILGFSTLLLGFSRFLLGLDSLGFSLGWALVYSWGQMLSASTRARYSLDFFLGWVLYRLLLHADGWVYPQGAPMPKSEMVLHSSDRNHSYLPLVLTSYLYSFLNGLTLYLWTFFLHRFIIYAPLTQTFI